MNTKRKRGFTIVELVIVIAIIGVLSAILIPTFIGLVNSAKEVADSQMVRNLNTALANDSAINGKHETAYDAIQVANETGYSVEKLTPTSFGYDIVWDQKNDRFMLIDDKGEVKYYDQSTEPSEENKYELWKIYDKVPELAKQKYSIYLAGETTEPVTVNGVGFDAGEKTGITKVTYNGSNGIEVVIRTNGGVLEVNAENDTVNHYGSVKTLTINAVKEYNEYDHVGKLEITGTVNLVAHSGAKFCQSKEEIVALVGNNSELGSAIFDAHNYENDVCSVCGKTNYNVEKYFDFTSDGKLILKNEYGMNDIPQNLIIPSIINGQMVKTIEENAFNGFTSLKSVELPETVTEIGVCAFMGCTSLTEINFPSNLNSIGGGAFWGCEKLQSVNLSQCEGLTTIGGCAFMDCTNLDEIKLPKTITIIDGNAFMNCVQLKIVDLSQCEVLTTIYDYAFSQSGLTEINLPSSLDSIGQEAFNGCSGLTIKYNGNTENWIEINGYRNVSKVIKVIECNNGNLKYNENTGDWEITND